MSKIMKIFFTHYLHDYTPDWKVTPQNYAPDYHIVYLPLAETVKAHGHELIPFWTDEVIKEKGREGMKRALFEAIIEGKPDVCLFYSGNEDDYAAVLPEIRRRSKAVTVFYGLDDSWRFDHFSRNIARYFSWIVTYYAGAIPKYHRIGCTHIFNSIPGVDTHAYPPPVFESDSKDIDVSFVGTWSKRRGEIVQDLQRAGLNVHVRGNGWPEAAISREEMVRIYSRSKIILTLNPPAFNFSKKSLARLFLRRAYLGEGGPSVKFDILNFFANFRSWRQKRILQIKVRFSSQFGALEMTQDADNLRDFFVPDKEIVLYANTQDLAQKIRYYLAHPEEREAITRAGYARTLRDHDAKKRIEGDFKAFGMPL